MACKSCSIKRFISFVFIGVFGIANFSVAQIANPADKQEKDTAAAIQKKTDTLSNETVVFGKRTAGIHDEDQVGAYLQPRWTTQRRFTETRVYVIPKGQFEFEYWLVPEVSHDGKHVEITQQYEVEMGLPYRIQVDLYVNSHQQGNSGPQAFDEQKFEVRWALANWGVLPGNPTLYLEWVSINNEPSHIEGKLLLGGKMAPRLHWGANVVFEHQTAAQEENNYELTCGASYTVRDAKASVGAEVKLALTDEKSDRGTFTTELLIGPSFQVCPIPRSHIDLVVLAGATDDSPSVKPMLVIGWEF